MIERMKHINIKSYIPLFICGFLAVAVLVLCTPPARAYALFDVVDDIDNWIKTSIFIPIIESLLNSMLDFVKQMADVSLLTAAFNDVLGTGNTGTTSLYNLMKSVHQGAVLPIGHSILALVMLVQLVKISQRIDATSTLPAVKDIVFLVVVFVIFTWVINHSLDLCAAVYNVVVDIIEMMTDPQAINFTIQLDAEAMSNSLTFGDLGMWVLLAAICFLVGVLTLIVSFAMTYFRAFQLYLYAAFSPIPFALMGFEETRQMGIGFCKNFIAVCLAGAIMAFCFMAYPVLLGAILGTSQTILSIGELDIRSGSVLILLKCVGASIVMIFALIKSGGIARDIMGG